MKIALSVALAFLLVGCGSSEEKKEVQQTEPKEVTQKQEPLQSIVNEATSKVTQMTKDAKEVATPTMKKVQEISNVVKEEVVPQALEKVQEAAKVVKKEVTNVIATTPSGENLFKTCSACHGSNAEKKALGKSQIIKGWDSAKVTKALSGYKAGTYGGSMKGIMHAQASKLTDADIKALANYISKL